MAKVLCGYYGSEPMEITEFASVGRGWYSLIEELTEKLVKMAEEAGIEDFRVVDVKEKFGGLRYYVTEATEEMWQLIHEAEEKSFEICEECGAKGELMIRGHWYGTRCPRCAEKGGWKRID